MIKYLLILLISFSCFSQSGLIARQNFGKRANTADVDAVAFMNAIAIPNDGTIYYTGTPQEITGAQMHTAINNLVVGLKTYLIWSHIKAFYPFLGGTSASHKWNLKDPRDLDAAFRLTFANTPTQSKLGIQTNGSNNYANTYLNPSIVFSDKATSFGFYQTVINTISGTDRHYFGCDTNSATNFMDIESINVNSTRLNYLSNVGIITLAEIGKFNNANSTTTTKSITVGSVSSAYTSTSGNFPNLNLWIGCLNFNNGYYNGVDSTFGAAWVMTGLSDAQVSQLRTLVLNYQTALFRN